jgi:hypothetical protein
MAEPTKVNSFPSASLLERIGNPVCGAARNANGFKKSKIPPGEFPAASYRVLFNNPND